MSLRDPLGRVASAAQDIPALIWCDQEFSYGSLTAGSRELQRLLADSGVGSGTVVSLQGDFSPRTLAALIALLDLQAIVVPLVSTAINADRLCAQAQVEVRVSIRDETIAIARSGVVATHQHYEALRATAHPGIVLFSSGSDGQPKAAVHDYVRFAERYGRPGRASRICAFLAFDHIGGLNTVLYSFANGGCLIVPRDRSPEQVCHAIAAHQVEVLPTTPTFLNLMLFSGAIDRFSLRSLTLVTYGTEVMPPATLRRLRTRLPGVRLLQTYGLSETGILATRSPDVDSLWFTITGPNVETRVVDGILHVRTPMTMLGYLDGVSSKMLPDGWFDTGDLVERNDELFRVVGRAGDLVNVGGLKVHPSEVEAVILEMDGVLDALVRGETNAITGQHLRLDVVLASPETVTGFRRRLEQHCSERLPRYKTPQRVVISGDELYGPRYKKLRSRHPFDAPTEPSRRNTAHDLARRAQ